MCNRYRVVPSWDELQKKEVVIEADYFKSSSFEGKAVTEFYSKGEKERNSKDDELVAVFWGEVIVIKQP